MLDQNEEQKSHCCDDCLRLVQLAIDGEISSLDQNSLLGELEKCSSCFEKYNIEKSFKDFLCAKIERKSIDPGTLESIKAAITNISARNS